MKFLIFGFSILFSLSSFADIIGPLENSVLIKQLTEKKSYYKILSEKFQNGLMPQTSKLLDVLWSGRCFKRDKPYTPLNAALHFRKKTNQDVGPIGDENVFYEVATIWQKYSRPDYFDNKDASFLDGKYGLYKPLYESDNFLFIRLPGDRPMISKIRLSGNYLVEEISGSQNDLGDIDEEFEDGIMCYYFISSN